MTESIKRLRARVREQRRALTAPARIAAAEHIADRLLALPSMPESGFVAGYWAVDGEVSLHALLLRMPRTLDYCLPVVRPDHVMQFAAWRPGEPVVVNRFGIPEPDVGEDGLLDASQMSFVVTPLVAFDASCHRIGMGGGWYDRAFAHRNGVNQPMVGVGFALQQVDVVHAQPWDVRLDAICTETATIVAPRTELR